jgi:hypothetical protein
MQSIYYDGIIYFKAKPDITKIKDPPNFIDNSILLKKQSLGVCKLRVYESSGCALGIPKRMVFTIMG